MDQPDGVLAMSQLLPRIKDAVVLEYRPESAEGPFQRYRSRVVAREGRYDFLDAPRSSSETIVTLPGDHRAFLEWGSGSYVYRFAIRIEEVLEPLPSLKISYQSQPTRRNRRQQWRAKVNVPGRYRIDEEPVDLPEATGPPRPWIRTMTRDVSYSSVRFFTPDILTPKTPVTVEWHLVRDQVFTGTMAVIHMMRGESYYRGLPGQDVVARWSPPLIDAQAQQWQGFCDSHRYDYRD